MEVWELGGWPHREPWFFFDWWSSKIILGITARCNDQLGAFRWETRVPHPQSRGSHSDMSLKALPTGQVVDTTHRHWSIDQHRSLPHRTVARHNMLLTAHLFGDHARRMMDKFHSCFLEKSRFTDNLSSALQRHLQSTFCWHNTPPLADSSLSTRWSASFIWQCACARL